MPHNAGYRSPPKPSVNSSKMSPHCFSLAKTPLQLPPLPYHILFSPRYLGWEFTLSSPPQLQLSWLSWLSPQAQCPSTNAYRARYFCRRSPWKPTFSVLSQAHRVAPERISFLTQFWILQPFSRPLTLSHCSLAHPNTLPPFLEYPFLHHFHITDSQPLKDPSGYFCTCLHLPHYLAISYTVC